MLLTVWLASLYIHIHKKENSLHIHMLLKQTLSTNKNCRCLKKLITVSVIKINI
jgi:hypothetical protein